MIRLLVIADDLTGALDTGARLAAGGAETLVLPAWRDVSGGLPEILVVNAKTRHLPPDEARRIVREICVRCPAERIYKKTDSALRGNVGAELAGVLDACPEMEISFVPAFPAVGRTVRDGRLSMKGVPIQKTAFGRDPFEPVRTDCVADVLRAQADEKIVLSVPGDVPGGRLRRIRVWDAETDADLSVIARTIAETDGTRLLAGCAGFAGALPDAFGFRGRKAGGIPAAERMLVLCGSLHPATKAQISFAAARGMARIRLDAALLAVAGAWDLPEGRERLRGIVDRLRAERVLMIDTADPGANAGPAGGSKLVAESLGALFRGLVRSEIPFLPLLTGGDTLSACMDALGADAVRPLGEAADGVVIARFSDGGKAMYMLTKSGGFGGETLIADLVARFVLRENGSGNTDRVEGEG